MPVQEPGKHREEEARMAMELSCPHCGVAVSVEDSAAGQTVRCPKCEQVFAVPSAADVPVPASIAAAVPTEAPVDPALCVICGTRLLASDGEGVRKCADCAKPKTGTAKVLQQKQFKAFERAGGKVTAEGILGRPISATVGRLLLGVVIIDILVFVGALFGWLISLFGCIAGLVMVGKTAFRDPHPLDEKRWLRFWHGAVLGYWLSYMLVMRVATRLLEGRIESIAMAMIMLCIYLLACVVGAGIGFLNVYRTDRKDKEATVRALREWHEVRASEGIEAGPAPLWEKR